MQVFSRRNLKKGSYQKSKSSEEGVRERILKAARKLFARRGYEGTTTKDLASQAKVAEGTLFRYFSNKKAILIEVATAGWVEILTDLLTELSEMRDCKAISQMMKRRMLNMHANADLLRVCFFEAQYHPELREKIQAEVISKMTGVAEAFFETAMDKGIYRRTNPRVVAKVFLGMFAIAGFSESTIIDPQASPQAMQEMAEGIADIFLHGVLAPQEN